MGCQCSTLVIGISTCHLGCVDYRFGRILYLQLLIIEAAASKLSDTTKVTVVEHANPSPGSVMQLRLHQKYC